MKSLKRLGLMGLALGTLGFASNVMAQCGGMPGFAHPNGGGFVALTADVAPSVEVSSDSQVCSFARLSGDVKVVSGSSAGDFAVIEGNVTVSNFSSVEGFSYIKGSSIAGSKTTLITNDSFVTGHSFIGEAVYTEYSTIYGNAQVLGESEVRNGTIYGHAVIAGSMVNDGTVHGQATIGEEGEVTNNAIVCNNVVIEESINGGWEYCDSALSITKLSNSSSANHVCAIGSTSNGSEVVCFGDNTGGQLGIGFGEASQPAINLSNRISGISDATDVSTGFFHTCVVRNDNTVECFGNNDFGQLGDGTTTSSATPVVVTGLTGISKISSGDAHTCALSSTGAVSCWGINENGQVGNNSTADVLAPVTIIASGALDIATGQSHTCAVLSDNSLQCWGSNLDGQVGVTPTGGDILVPTTVSGLSNIQQVITGASFSCALDDDYTMACFGNNDSFQLGVPGSSTEVPQIADFEGPDDSILSASGNGVCAIAEGELNCWGNSQTIGTGDQTNSAVTVSPAIGDRVPSLVGSSKTSVCAVMDTNQLMCWGSGSLATESTSLSLTPVFADYIK